MTLLHERDTKLFREAEDMVDNTLRKMARFSKNKDGKEYLGKWNLSLDNLAAQTSGAFIEIDPNLEGK